MELPARLWLHSLLELPSPDELACLSADEHARAARFMFEQHRRRFLAARCALRQRLGEHLGVPAQALRFAEGPFGKPWLPDAPGCRFNLSHSEDLAVVAIGDACEIGVDIEVLRSVSDAAALARSYFDDAECEALLALDEAQRDEAFLRVWTRKEACMKATGLGLQLAPRGLPVGLDGGPVRLEARRPEGAVPLVVRSVAVEAPALVALAWVDAA